MSPTFRSLSNRNYRLYASGAVVSNVGTWMQRVAQDWLVLQLTHNSGSALGITTGLQFLPILLLSPYAGLVADLQESGIACFRSTRETIRAAVGLACCDSAGRADA